MDIILRPLINIVLLVINLYIWVIIIQAVLSWLVAFNVVNPYNQVVGTIGEVLHRLTEPALRPIRQYMPNMGGVDLSPFVLILGLIFVQMVLQELLFRIV